MTTEQKAKAYDEAIKRMKSWVRGEHPECFTEAQKAAEFIFPELKESEDERIKQRIIKLIKMSNEVGGFALHKWEADEMLAWLEKQGCQNSVDKEYTFKSILRLLEMIEPTDRAKSYCQKLIDSLLKEGYATDARIVSDCLKQMNGEKVAMATMDEQNLAEWGEEDEKIRKWLIAQLELKSDGLNPSDLELMILKSIAWLEKQGDCSAKWEKNTADNKPTLNHSVLMKNIHGVAEGEWNGKEWIQYRWSSNIKDSDVLYWMNLCELEKQGESNPYSGVSFEYNGNIWGMCARDNGVDILFNKKIIQHISDEKQGEQNTIIEMKSPEESLGISSKEYNEIVNECLYGESKTADKTEPMFKVGDWLVQNERRNIIKVVDTTPLDYKVVDILGYHHIITDDCIENNYHLWTIQDSKDGDVLVFKQNYPFIYNGHYNTFYVGAHCGVSYEAKKFYIARENGWAILEGVYPATKEQRDALMKAMADVGYTFDFEKKELKEIVIPPIFNIGDVLCDKSRTTLNKNYQPNFEIIDIKNGMYICNNCTFPISQQDEYELVAKRIEPQHVWSAEEATYIHEVETGNGNIKALVTEKVKLPKFKVGDWITNGDYTWEVVEIMVLDYVLRSQDGNIVDDTISHTDEQFHLWTIHDEKEGDVLVTKYNQPFIYNGNYDLFNVGAYCGMDCLGEIFIESCTNCQWSSTKVKPATKDQRDALERAMTNAGYRWNKEKLKLERI